MRQATDAAQRAQREMSGGSERSARSQQNLVQAIQRTTAQMEAGSRTSARYFEVLAQQRGVDPAALQPYLQQLRAIEQAQQGTGQSAAQTANAMRQVPAQLTDIITSLQGGMEPLTVLIQQGGQLRDSFGGIGPAARAMGAQVLALVNPFTVAAAAAAVLTLAYYQGSQEADAYRNSLIMTGNAVGASADQLADMARAISDANGTQSDAAQALVALVEAGNVPAERLQQFAAVAIALQEALGKSVSDTAKEFAELGEKPVEASERLNSKYHYLTAAVYEQIKALEEQGRTEDAAAVAQEAYSAAMDKRTKEVVKNLGYIESRWKELGEFASKAWDKMLGVGRKDTVQDELDGLLKMQQRMQQNIANFQAGKDTWGERSEKARLAGVEAAIAVKREMVEEEKAAAKAAADEVALNEKKIEVGKALATVSDRLTGVNRQYLTDLRALQDAREKGLISDERYKALVSKLAAEEYKRSDAGKAALEASKAAAAERKKDADMLAELSGVTSTYTEEVARLHRQYSTGNLSQERYVELMKELISKQPGAKKLLEESAKEMADYAKATTSANEALEKERDAITQQVQATKDHNEQIGLSKIAIAELEAERLEALATRKEENADIALGVDLTGRQSELYLEQAAALRALAAAKRKGAIKEAAAESAKDVAQDWKRATESMQQSLTDALMRGFESGKGFGRNLVDTIKNMFNTLVLRPIVSAIVNPVAGAVSGALGFAGAAQAAGSAAAGSSALSGATGVLGAVGAMSGAFGTGVASGLSAWAAGGSVTGLLGSGTLFAGGIANGLGLVAGALGPIALGIGAAVAIWKKFDTSGTYHMGGASSADSSGSRTIRAESIGFEKTRINAETERMTATLASGVVAILDSTALAFGKTAGYTAATAFADDTSKDGAWGALVISKMGQSLVDWRQGRTSGWAPREFADGEEGQKQYLAALTSSVRSALNSIGLPDWARTMLDGVASDASLEDLANVVDQINKTQAAFAAMRSQLVGFASLSEAAMGSLMSASGGIEKLFSNASAYYDAFYTEAERNATVSGQIAKALAAVNLQMPTTREGFRALVEAQTALGAQGAESLSVLLGVAGAFAQITPEVEAAATNLDSYRSKLTDAYNAESQALQSTITRMGSFAASLRDLNKSALLGGMSPLSPQQKYAEAKSQFEAVAAAARNGDEKAQDRYNDAYTAFLEASRSVFASSAEFRLDFDYAQAMTAEMAQWADTRVSVDQAQLDALKAQVSGIIEVNASVLSVRDALREYNEQVAKSTAPLVSTTPTVSIPYYPSEGRTNDAALAIEMATLRQEVAGLRADQQKQTGDQITGTAKAMSDAAVDIAKAVTQPWKFKNDETRVSPE